MSDETVGAIDTKNEQIPLDPATGNPALPQPPETDPAPSSAAEEIEDPVAMVLVPPGFRVAKATRLFSLRDEPGEQGGAPIRDVPEGSTLGRGKLELDRDGKTYVTASYSGSHGWAPVSCLGDA